MLGLLVLNLTHSNKTINCPKIDVEQRCNACRNVFENVLEHFVEDSILSGRLP